MVLPEAQLRFQTGLSLSDVPAFRFFMLPFALTNLRLMFVNRALILPIQVRVILTVLFSFLRQKSFSGLLVILVFMVTCFLRVL